MIRFTSILLVSILFACGMQQKTVKNTTKVNESIIDSLNAQHDKVATNNSLNNTTKKNDSVTFTKNVKFVKSKNIVYFNHEAWNALLKKYVTKGGIVNYKDFKKDQDKLQTYISSLSKNIPTNTSSKNEKLAYWINAYNAMTVDLILQNYPLESIKDINNPWKQELWTLGGKEYDLNTIEHKILRKMNEPRIHFAINCASFSCPPLLNKAFTAKNMDAQLTQVTKNFLADSKRNTITQNKVEISKIFKWFSSDFKQNGSLIDFLNKYSEIKINEAADVDYKNYNWSLNE